LITIYAKSSQVYRILTKPPIHQKELFTQAILTKEEKVTVLTVLYPDCTDFGLLDPKAVKTDKND
jgi:hypothetical protein